MTSAVDLPRLGQGYYWQDLPVGTKFRTFRRTLGDRAVRRGTQALRAPPGAERVYIRAVMFRGSERNVREFEFVVRGIEASSSQPIS